MSKQINLMRSKESGDYLISTLGKEKGVFKSISLDRSELLELYNLIDLLKFKSCFWCKHYNEKDLNNKCEVVGISDYDPDDVIDCMKCEFDDDKIDGMLGEK